MNPENGFRLAVLVEGAIGLVAVGMARLFGISLSEQFPANRAGWIDGLTAGVVATLPMLVVFCWMLNSRWSPLVGLREQVRRMVGELFPNAGIAELATIAALAGVGEELMFRGVLQTGIAEWTTPVAGLVVASVIFGALHAVTRLYFALATLIGLFLGWLLMEFHDLTIPIVAHGLYDFVALIYLTRNPPDETLL